MLAVKVEQILLFIKICLLYSKNIILSFSDEVYTDYYSLQESGTKGSVGNWWENYKQFLKLLTNGIK